MAQPPSGRVGCGSGTARGRVVVRRGLEHDRELPSIDVEVSEPVDRVDFIDGETKETLFLVFIGWLNRIRGITSPEVVQVYRMHSKYEPIETFVAARTRIDITQTSVVAAASTHRRP